MTDRQKLFERWFRDMLRERNIDLGFESQLLAILTDNEEGLRAEYLNDALDSLTPGNYSSFCEQAAKRFENPSLCLDYAEPLDPVFEGVSASRTRSSPLDAEREPEDDDEWCQDEILMADGLDWAALADDLESRLEASAPGVLYSTEALFTALTLCNCDVHSAYTCIKEAEAESAGCKPCRHLISGRCLRKDCMFDHDLAQVVCRYWLTVGCASETCPFLHSFPYRESYQVDYSQEDNYEEIPANEFPTDFNAAFPTLPSKPRSYDPMSLDAAAPTSPAIVLGFNYGTRREMEERELKASTQSKTGKTTRIKGRESEVALPSQWVTSGD